MPVPKRIATLGNAFLDRVIAVAGLPTEPGKQRALGQTETGGGIAATAACTVARLGAVTQCFTRVGDDAAGAEIVARLAKVGVATAGIRVIAGARSQQGTIIVAPDGERMGFGFMGEGLTPEADWIEPAALDGVDGVMADYSWWQGAERIFGLARARGSVSVMDADIGDLDAVRRLLPLPDHVVFSERCLSALTGAASLPAALKAIAGAARGQVSVTAGGNGFYWLDGDEVRHLPAFAVKAIDTNGAGDVFHGAFTLALAEGHDIAGAARFASATAALKCAAGSGWESIPDRAAVDSFLNGGRT